MYRPVDAVCQSSRRMSNRKLLLFYITTNAMLPVLLLTIATIINVATAAAGNNETALQNEDFENKFIFLDPIKSLIKSHKIVAVGVINGVIGQNCYRDLAILDQAIVRRKTWALKMLDASSKIPSGVLEGNVIDLGMFNECMDIKGKFLGIEIRGHHCMYSIASTSSNVTVPLNPTLSICMPSTCTGSDIVKLFNGMIGMVNRLKDLGTTVASATCTSVNKEIWDREFIVYFSIIAMYMGLLLICTVCDAILRRRDAGKHVHIVLSTLAKFSLIKGASSILSTQVREGNLPAIHGIRFLAMNWIVLGHEYVFHFLGVNVNFLSMVNWTQSWKSLYIYIAPFTVDTFFTLSGFLMTHVFLNQIRKEKRFNILKYYLHRYLRLTPAVAALIVFTVVFVPKISSGPRWYTLLSVFGESCREKWWTNLLYVQNFVQQDNFCLGHLWYLAVDMQLFFISPIILYPLYKKPKLGLAILFALFLASLAIPGIIVGINKYPPFSFIQNNDLELVMNVFKEIYEMPYNRASPWLIGIFLGFEVSNNNRSLGKLSVLTGWLTSIGVFAFCTFGSRTFVVPSYKYNVIWESFFLAVSRPIWAAGVCWIIYASLNNYAGPLSTVLSWKFFQPLSRISYCVYLVHYVIQLMQQSALRTPNYFSDYYIFHDFLADLLISIVAGFFFSLLFESPFLVLEKILFRRQRKSVDESQKDLIPEVSEVEQA